MTDAVVPALSDIRYRVMTPADIPGGLRLSNLARWNQTEADWRLFLAMDRECGRVAETSDGAVIGTVTTARYGNRFSWVAMVLVDPDYRRRGIGTRLLNEALAMRRGDVTMRLDATPAGQPLYERLGFRSEYALSRMEVTTARPLVHSPTAASIDLVRPMTDGDFNEVCERDRKTFGADRRPLLESLRARAPQYARVMRDGEGVSGYVFGRSGFRFEHLGPVMASNAAAAATLVASCLHPNRPFILDVPHHSPDWSAWVREAGFTEQRPFVRMYLGDNRYPGEPNALFAVTGPEFG